MAAVPLPVIVGFGGVNPAGRSSGHHATARMLYTGLDAGARQRTLQSLAALMGVTGADLDESYLLQHSLVRRLEVQHFNPDAVRWNRRLPLQPGAQPLTFEVRRQHLPQPLPEHWQITPLDADRVSVSISEATEFLLPTTRDFEVKAAGQLPTGFEPGSLYASRNHPRGLQLTVFAASDALGYLGIPWDKVRSRVAPEQISVYAGSAMGQMDPPGAGGMLSARANGQRVTSKYCPLSLAEMPADFVNAYVLGSLGSTGATLGACASFLYNLRHGIQDIRSGRARVAVVGSSEAPLNPEIMEGYGAMGALATDKDLRQLDGLAADAAVDHRRACRPFADNCGFTIAESAQVVVLFDDALALELGATCFGAATDVFVNADGFKKSISSPGVGNYLTVARAAASIRSMLGDQALRQRGMVQAHGTGTPQNRTTESEILSRVARAFGIEDWPVAALKCYIGHSLASASGDQITAALGTWAHGMIPGISTIDALADDVKQDGLSFVQQHRAIDPDALDYSIVNSKGFGGNNASGVLLSPSVTQRLLLARHGEKSLAAWAGANEAVVASQHAYDNAMSRELRPSIYHFDHGVLGDADVQLSDSKLSVGALEVLLDEQSPYRELAPK